MKKIVTLAAIAALATLTACTSEEAAAPEATATEVVAEEAAPELNEDGSVVAGGGSVNDNGAAQQAK